MSEQLIPADDSGGFGGMQIQPWQEQRPAPPPMAKSPIERPVAAMRRYKWLILAIVIVSSTAGVLAMRLLKPMYEVHASLMLATASPMDERGATPIRGSGLLAQDDWIQLLKSFAITDAVVKKLTLYVKPDNPGDSALFKNFSLAERAVFAEYELLIDKTRKHWTLSIDKSGLAVVDSGTIADSVGRNVGLLWQLPRWAFNASGQQKVRFTVSTPREISVGLTKRLVAIRPEEASNFLILSFQDPDRVLAARAVNTWLAEYVSVAGDLKKRKLTGFTNTLEGQLQSAKSALEGAESGLSEFKVKTITEPTENVAVSAGSRETNDPVIKAYLTQAVDYDNIKHDIASLDDILRQVAKDSISAETMLQIRSVESGGTPAQALRQAFQDYSDAQNKLTASQVGLTDEHPMVKQFVLQVDQLKREKIPGLARQLATTLRTRAEYDSVRIAAGGKNLRQIPQRTIEEERLRRVRDLNAGLFANLQGRFAEAQLAEASAAPDVTVLDTAIAPLDPIKAKGFVYVLAAIFGGLGGAIALAILLDKLDGRLRYPEQATDELGLPIAGTVPRIPKQGVDERSPEQMFQLVESFRSLRMSVTHASGPTVSIAVSSPSPGEGKSLISSNLAMSFADSGLRTVLVDGDTRRGTLHDMFGLSPSPGLTDYLAGHADTGIVIRQTDNEKLSIITCGVRQRRSPELLTSPRLATLVDHLKANYDVVIFDTPPLAAGIDGYSIAAAAGSLLLVLRVGETERRMAAAKMRMFERLPVDVVGAVLDGIEFQGEYEYYGYVGGYAAVDEPGTAVAQVP